MEAGQPTSATEHHIYCISGLGLDERLFMRVQIDAPNVHFIKWIEPHRRESIEDYALRMLEQVRHEQNITLIGVSFGGIMAIEMAKLKRVQRIILVSSIKTHEELPWFFNLLKIVPIYKLSNPYLRKKTREVWGVFFGLFDKEALDFFEDMFETMSERYKTWGTQQIANWKNDTYPSHLHHIHGTKDMIFPFRNIKMKQTHIIEGGNHGMIVTKAAEVSAIINQLIAE